MRLLGKELGVDQPSVDRVISQVSRQGPLCSFIPPFPISALFGRMVCPQKIDKLLFGQSVFKWLTTRRLLQPVKKEAIQNQDILLLAKIGYGGTLVCRRHD